MKHSTTIREAVAESLAAGNSIRQTCKKLEVSERTVYEWKHDLDFSKAVESRRAEFMADLRQEFRSIAESAVEAVKDAVTGARTLTMTQWKAVEAVLRSTGLVGEKAEVEPSDVNETVELIPIGLNDNDEFIPLDPIK